VHAIDSGYFPLTDIFPVFRAVGALESQALIRLHSGCISTMPGMLGLLSFPSMRMQCICMARAPGATPQRVQAPCSTTSYARANAQIRACRATRSPCPFRSRPLPAAFRASVPRARPAAHSHFAGGCDQRRPQPFRALHAPVTDHAEPCSVPVAISDPHALCAFHFSSPSATCLV